MELPSCVSYQLSLETEPLSILNWPADHILVYNVPHYLVYDYVRNLTQSSTCVKLNFNTDTHAIA